MKKRSVLSAVAMLLVSALVLTSATYAWFASTSTANVNNVSANVTTADGSLLISAQNGSGTWSSFRPTITTSDLPTFPSYLMPVSLDVDELAEDSYNITTYKVGYDGANFTPGGVGTANGSNGDFINYNLRVQYKTNSTTPKDIDMTPDFARTSTFTYALVSVTYDGKTNCYLFSGDSYVPVTAIGSGLSITDDKLDVSKVEGVIDATDDNYATAATMGSAITTYTDAATTATPITILDNAASATGVLTTMTVDIAVYIWAEGQDANCVGGASAGDISLGLDFAAV